MSWLRCRARPSDEATGTTGPALLVSYGKGGIEKVVFFCCQSGTAARNIAWRWRRALRSSLSRPRDLGPALPLPLVSPLWRRRDPRDVNRLLRRAQRRIRFVIGALRPALEQLVDRPGNVRLRVAQPLRDRVGVEPREALVR